jgi:hypothetical protein
MNTQLSIEERLWEYIDGSSDEAEKKFIEELIQSNLEWRAKYAELLEVHQLMQSHLELEEPSMRFTQNVMENIAKFQISPATKSYINKNIIRGIGGFFILMLLGLIVYGFAQVSWTTGSDGSSLPIDLNRVEWSRVFNNTYTNIFMMINVVLGLVLLDMYLSKKKREAHPDRQV